jgi:hypothetical protein
MPKIIRTALLAAALSTSLAAAPAYAGCQPVAAVGTGVTEGIAKVMAEAAIKNVIEGKGLKPSGAVKLKCEAGSLYTECRAQQMGCK